MMKKCLALLLLLTLTLAACAFPALAEMAGGTLIADWTALKEGDRVAIYYAAGKGFIGEDTSGAGLALVPEEDPTAFGTEGVALFTVGLADGYYTFRADGGYLTAGATGNSLALTETADGLSAWAFEPCASEGCFYLRNKAALYKDSAQYLEFYSGHATTYGLRSGGSAYEFAFYLVGEGGAPAQAKEEIVYPVEIAVMFTGDLHGALYHTSYTSGESGAASTGLTRLATRIGDIREQYENTLLIDVGDLVQGTPLTYYYSFARPDVPDPAFTALRTLGYDAFVLGNHEFNYGLDILNRQIACATAPSSGDETSVPVLAANYVREGTKFEPWVGAYIVKDFDANGAVVRVGVLGLSTPNIPAWEKAANYEGITFKSFMATWRKYASVLKNKLGCDLVIAACHSGTEGAEGELIDGEYYEWANQITALVSQTSGIDLVLGGHSHAADTIRIKNRDGARVTVQHAGARGELLGLCVLGIDPATGERGVVSSKTLPVDASTAPDPALTAKLQPYEDACWQEYMDGVLGTATAAFEAPGNMLAPCAFLDLLHAAQIEGGYDKHGYTADTDDDERPRFSLTAPLNTGDDALLPAGDITMGQMFKLYRFENWLYTVDMTAAELRAWLECAADRQYGIDANGLPFGGGTYCDCLYGDGVSYVIDLSREPGDRVTDFSLDIADTDTRYRVVLNNYRYTGGGKYCEYVYNWLSARGIASDLVAYNETGMNYQINDARQVFSTQYGMDGGEDYGQARNLLAQYIANQRVLSPEITSDWRVTTGK